MEIRGIHGNMWIYGEYMEIGDIRANTGNDRKTGKIREDMGKHRNIQENNKKTGDNRENISQVVEEKRTKLKKCTFFKTWYQGGGREGRGDCARNLNNSPSI